MILIAMVFHVWTWFAIMPKTMPRLVIGGCYVEPRLITAAGIMVAALARSCYSSLHNDIAMKRSIAPIFWLMFGAGGMLAALFGPALVIMTGLAAPIGVGLSPNLIDYSHAIAFGRHPLASSCCWRSSPCLHGTAQSASTSCSRTCMSDQDSHLRG